MRKPGLVATDMDGTLLGPLEEVTAATVEVVHRVLADDVPIVLATGRPPRWVPHVARELGLTSIAVCSNGALLYDIGADRVIYAATIEPLVLHDAMHALAHALPEASFCVERPTERAWSPGEAIFAESHFHSFWPNDGVKLVRREELAAKPAVKMLVLHEHMTSDEMYEVARNVLGDEVQVTYSTSIGILELSSPGVDKSTGLAMVADKYGVAPAEVIAFGDMPNDVAMLRWAGHGVAMGHAHAQVRGVADEVTATNSEDGVVRVLERWW